MIRFILFTFFLIYFPVVAQQEIDAVAEGKRAFATYGCLVCHAFSKDDKTFRTGPNLFGLFQNQPRNREVLNPNTGRRSQVKADKQYYTTSVRKSWDALAISESGQTKGKPYPQIMPMYAKEVIPDQAIEYIWHFLRTRAAKGQAGPLVVRMKQDKKVAPNNPIEIPNEMNSIAILLPEPPWRPTFLNCFSNPAIFSRTFLDRCSDPWLVTVVS